MRGIYTLATLAAMELVGVARGRDDGPIGIIIDDPLGPRGEPRRPGPAPRPMLNPPSGRGHCLPPTQNREAARRLRQMQRKETK